MSKHQDTTTISSPSRRRLLLRYCLLHALLLLAAVGFLVADRYELFDSILICPWHLLGIYCPTCGLTRATHALLRLDLAAVMRYHPCLPLLLLCLLHYEAFAVLRIVRHPDSVGRPGRCPAYITLFVFLLFFLLRNLLLFAFSIDPIGDFL